MAHTEIQNELPFVADVLHLMNQHGVPVATAVIKGTYTIGPDGLSLAEEQQPIFYAGKPYGEPGESSYKYEPEVAYHKAATDVVLIGSALASRSGVSQLDVEFSVGHLHKSAVVIGDRHWYGGFTGPHLIGPEPFEEIPLIYERCFGGWDRSHADPNQHSRCGLNPLGRGFQSQFGAGQDLLPLPNIEDPYDRISDLRSRPNPVGFGFISPDWEPRASFAGTYDENWTETRMPALPLDFDPRFFNAAAAGLVAKGYLSGHERVSVRNCSPEQYLSFELPGAPAPECRFVLSGKEDQQVTGVFDTLVVDLTERIVVLTWRCHVPVPRGPEQLRELVIKQVS